MGLARAWRRRLYASVGLVVVVPAALMVLLILLAVGGSSFSLASLGQVISGPSAPTVQPVALGAAGRTTIARRGAGRSAGPTLLAAALTPSAGGPAAGSPSGSSHNGSGGGTGTGGNPGGGGGNPGGGNGGGGGGGGHGGGGGGGGGGSGGGATHHSHHPTVADKVVGTVTPVTSSLPAPAGPILTQVVKSAGKVADKVLHKLPIK